MGAASVAACSPRKKSTSRLHVLVVGAGIVGASIAYHLVKTGTQVTIIDKEGPASHASRGTFAWINATWAKQPRHYHKLNQDSVSSWATFQKDLSIPIKWGGSLEWFEDEARHEKLAVQIEEQISWGERARMVTPEEYAALEPNVDFGDMPSVALSENDGAIDPVLATQTLIDEAIKLGAKLISSCELQNVSFEAGRLVSAQTNQGVINCGHIVLATGAAPRAAQDFAGVDIPQRTTPGVIAITKPFRPILNRIIVGPGAHIHQRLDGRIVLGEQDGAPKTEAHDMRLKNRPNNFPSREFGVQHGERILAIADGFIPGIAEAEVEDVFIGWRPLPLDGLPVLGAAKDRPDISLAIMHSGVSLAPIIGQLVTHEIVTGERLEQLKPYRPERDFTKANQY